MTKNLKISFILYLVYFAVIVTFGTLMNFFNGVGIGFISLIGILTTLTIMIFTDKYIMNRTKELFIAICSFAVLELIVFFILEYGVGNYKTWEVFIGIQHVLSFISLLCFADTVFRFICELRDIKISFIEIMLGNKPRDTKQKKAKELANGCLEDKPRNAHTIHEDVDNSEEDPSEEIIIEDEE